MAVNTVLPVSVSILADKVVPISVCSGTTVTFTAFPSNGGIAPVYQWKKGGANVGTNSAVYVDPGLVSGTVTCVMTSDIINCTTGNPATSNSISIAVISPTIYNVTGGIKCYVALGYIIGINGSKSGTTYWLFRDGVDLNISKAGTNSAINFGRQYTPGVYTVRAELNGCSVPMTGSATIYPLPTIDGVSNLCPAKTTQWTSPGSSPALSNPWISATPAVATVDNNGLITGVAPGTSDITYTDIHGCSKTQTIRVYAIPSITVDPVDTTGCYGDQAIFIVRFNHSGVVNYTWQRNDPGIGWTAIKSGNTNSSPNQLTIDNIGQNGYVDQSQYRVILFYSLGGCEVYSKIVTLSVNPLPTTSLIYHQ
jgi:hypothetical protein